MRLHTGDTSLYSALGEQAALLRSQGIGYSVVPGVSSLSAAAAVLGLELTVPGGTQTLICTRLEGRTPVPASESLGLLASHGATLSIFLSISMIERVVGELLGGGYGPATPAAVVYRASWPDELVLRGTLSDIGEKVKAAGIGRQALILVGEALGGTGGRSRLYDPGFTHGYRKGGA